MQGMMQQELYKRLFIRTTSDTRNRDNGALPVEYDNLLHKHLSKQ